MSNDTQEFNIGGLLIQAASREDAEARFFAMTLAERSAWPRKYGAAPLTGVDDATATMNPAAVYARRAQFYRDAQRPAHSAPEEAASVAKDEPTVVAIASAAYAHRDAIHGGKP